MSKEKWKPVPNFTSYNVSSLGRVRRVKKHRNQTPKLLNPFTVSGGYKQFQFRDNGIVSAIRINRLVLSVFDRPCNKGEEANHLDGDKSNNALSNLEWETPSGNMLHSYRTGLHKKQVGEKSHLSKLSISEVRNIRKEICEGDKSFAEIACSYGVCRSSIYRIRDGKTWDGVL